MATDHVGSKDQNRVVTSWYQSMLDSRIWLGYVFTTHSALSLTATRKSKSRKGKEAAGASGPVGIDGSNPTQVMPTQTGLVNNETRESLAPILPTEVQVDNLGEQQELGRDDEAESSHAGDQTGHGTGVEELAEPSMREVLDVVKTMGTQMLAFTRAFTPLVNSSVGQNVLNNLTEVRSSDRTDQTDRAVPRASRLELRLEPRPDDLTDRTTARLPRPTRHSKTHGRARLSLDREETKDGHAFLSGGPSGQSRKRPYLYPVHPSGSDEPGQ
uniref:Uncharacterized protein n=1 Tax=Brassica oleracea var. oleracea TaxID=109376 RepID=A0A0D3C9N3_BRAOL